MISQRTEATVLVGDALETLRTLPDESAQCCVTSPPYFNLRDYGMENQIGNEATPDEFIQRLVDVFGEVLRVLRNDGTLWLNLGDTYTQSGRGYDYDPKRTPKMRPTRVNSGKHLELGPKQLLGIPHRVAFALQKNGWIWRDTIIWHKPNPMPSSVKDRCTNAHEYVFMFSKRAHDYYYGFDEMQEPATYAGKKRGGSKNRYEQNTAGMDNTIYDTRNMRNVWSIKPDVGVDKGHFATFPKELARRCIVAGCPIGGTVLDPFLGSGTTAIAALNHGRKAIGIELNPEYAALARKRIDESCQQKSLFY